MTTVYYGCEILNLSKSWVTFKNEKLYKKEHVFLTLK